MTSCLVCRLMLLVVIIRDKFLHFLNLKWFALRLYSVLTLKCDFDALLKMFKETSAMAWSSTKDESRAYGFHTVSVSDPSGKNRRWVVIISRICLLYQVKSCFQSWPFNLQVLKIHSKTVKTICSLFFLRSQFVRNLALTAKNYETGVTIVTEQTLQVNSSEISLQASL